MTIFTHIIPTNDWNLFTWKNSNRVVAIHLNEFLNIYLDEEIALLNFQVCGQIDSM